MGKSASGKTSVTEYYMAIHFGIALKIDTLLEIHVGEKLAWQGSQSEAGVINVHRPELFGGLKKEGGVSGRVHFLPGGPDQVLPEELAERMGLTSATCPAYRGLASAFFISGDSATGWNPSLSLSLTGGGGGGVGGGGGGIVSGGGGGQGVWSPPGGRGLPNVF